MVPRIINESHPWSRLRQVGRGSATISHRTPDYVRADFTKLQRSLNATARPLACPAPDRTFTTELACAESLQTQVGYDYRNVRLAPDRTFTGCSVSLVGCTPTPSDPKDHRFPLCTRSRAGFFFVAFATFCKSSVLLWYPHRAKRFRSFCILICG